MVVEKIRSKHVEEFQRDMMWSPSVRVWMFRKGKASNWSKTNTIRTSRICRARVLQQ